MLFSCIAACILLHRMQGKHQDNNSDREYYFTAIAVARPPVLLLAYCFIVCRTNVRTVMVAGDCVHSASCITGCTLLECVQGKYRENDG